MHFWTSFGILSHLLTQRSSHLKTVRFHSRQVLIDSWMNPSFKTGACMLLFIEGVLHLGFLVPCHTILRHEPTQCVPSWSSSASWWIPTTLWLSHFPAYVLSLSFLASWPRQPLCGCAFNSSCESKKLFGFLAPAIHSLVSLCPSSEFLPRKKQLNWLFGQLDSRNDFFRHYHLVLVFTDLDEPFPTIIPTIFPHFQPFWSFSPSNIVKTRKIP